MTSGAAVSQSLVLAPRSFLEVCMTRVKICGITRVEDVLAASHGGADAIGLVFYQHSPRHVSIAQAAKLAAAVPPFIAVVGLFVNAEAAFVREVLGAVRLDLLQFHGEEPAEFCAQFGKPYIKAIRVKTGVNLLQCAADYSSATGLLLDAHVEGMQGGTGAIFDWALIPENMPLPVILSGGLQAENVAVAIKQVRPYAVDVSSGVEASKAIKDAVKITAFIKQVNSVNV